MKRAVLFVLFACFACGTSSTRPPPAPASAAPAPASALPAPNEPVPADRAACTKAHEDGRYETASQCFRALYAQSKDATCLLLLGRSLEMSRDLTHAVDAYSEYVATDGADANERKATEMRIRVLKEKIAVAHGAEALYDHARRLEEEGRWGEAASAYQRYLFAKGDSLSYIDRSSMELRITQLREKAATSRPAESPRR